MSGSGVFQDIFSVGGQGWDYKVYAYTTGLISDWVLGHVAVSITLCDGETFYLDDGWWGPIFSEDDVPWTVIPTPPK